jgi:hypothetical protein
VVLTATVPRRSEAVKGAATIPAGRGRNATVTTTLQAGISPPIAQARLNKGQRRDCGGIGPQDTRTEGEPNCAGALE